MMDSEVSVLLHCAAWRGLLEPQVQVELSERFNRRTDPALEREIEAVWTERVSKEPWLFNGSKFRLHSFCLASPMHASSSCLPPKRPPCRGAPGPHVPVLDRAEDQEGELNSRQEENLCSSDSLHDIAQNSLDERNRPVKQAENVDSVINQTAGAWSRASSTCDCRESQASTAELPSHKNTDEQETGPLLTLRLGLTCYRDYLGTNWSCRVAELRRRGEVEFGDPLALLAQPLGVGAVLCTADGQVVLIRRSQRVAEAGGLLDIPGGHPEPKVVCEHLGQAVCEEQISVDMMQQRPVVSELFSSVCAEIRDEVNIPLSSLGEPVLMGVALNHTSAGRPSAEFYVSCSLTSDEVRKLYWKGGAEAHESTDIIFLSRTEVLQLDRNSPLWLELCPSAKGAVLLYQTVEPDGERGPNRRHDTQLIASENGSA
ncbi:uridine diphosphate glucose pyrophosphatase NUDT22 [Siniperca chuatsi]|uniref:uridine diphosphate glucose pyrophosphatase NUDT22 n=1 Tax=Siniperca chuatsi TaxID=119488 RepID=UPI001CE14088|nr:uridine diphosphate glucose pyrophosphatase NUDT22 [Siniperca chuatsi]XP_044061285.1 uridine diphosphate glucose pyrophosphatase NUDT22 [Siniperca chuatsi]XP_044061286.1 uridine diphosphate glucose pyrophosphatase NUDT22 [Siniperca chuatsi]XP_044061287.1 uridine diphosphate glucose pyrophosphatase NUDT22 [Siniperca chuatsi]XP_044061288.1 uridine diphosphate glucose pyrophosphatase NUDT22 [Siniperca chuatsi]